MLSSLFLTFLGIEVLLTLAQSFDPAAAFNLPTGWSYNGCYTDNVRNRELSGEFFYDMGSNTLTAEKCIGFCASKNYTAAGLEYGGECYCGDTLPEQSGTTGCNMGCAGDNAQACGGPSHLTTYTSFITYQGINNKSSLGCYTDYRDARTLDHLQQVPGGAAALTPELCVATCTELGFMYAGVEYGAECFCGNSLMNNATLAAVGGCTMTCEGNSTELCGGPDRIHLYKQ